MALRAFPVLYAGDVAAVAAFYVELGFEEHFRMPAPDGSAGTSVCAETPPSWP